VRIALVGVGLIGGSIGLAARSRIGAEVVGFDPSPSALSEGLARGALDAACSSVASAVAGADAAFVAAPVAALPEAVREALEAAGPDCVVSDVGSTKRAIVAAARDPRFIGGHPLAGARARAWSMRARGCSRAPPGI
jgi:prephenate dehydrogenase